MWKYLTLVLVFLLSGICGAQQPEGPKPLVRYDANDKQGPVDPEQCGWQKAITKQEKISGRGVTKDAGTEFNAWQIVDNDDTRGENLYYYQTLPAAAEEKAARDGFTCQWRLRMPEMTPVSRAVSVEVCVNGEGRRRVWRPSA